ncbi:MAG: hypothetical protein M1608_08040, partial [Candidatus Omnitrophica bacterium]|nr:hypothetical protein [Candidatus Omnitrophota bacterium]
MIVIGIMAMIMSIGVP